MQYTSVAEVKKMNASTNLNLSENESVLEPVSIGIVARAISARIRSALVRGDIVFCTLEDSL